MNFLPVRKGDTGMKKILVFSAATLIALSGAAVAAETGMTKDANMGKHMMSSKAGMSSHKAAMKDGHAMKNDHAMKGTHDKAMAGKHKTESKTK
jgi:hypothetical protein